eukprot:scaffold250_cov110-Isochrysis_galbana.AAC.15
MHGPDRLLVLPNYVVNAAAALGDVAAEAPYEAQIRLRVDEDLDVARCRHLSLGKDQDSLDEDDAGGAHVLPALRLARVGGVVVDGHVHRLAVTQRMQVTHQQRRVERIGMVKVDLRTLLD